MQNRKTTIESNLKTFARSESDCTLRLGLSSLIKKHFKHQAVKFAFTLL